MSDNLGAPSGSDASASADENETSILDVALILAKRKFLIVGFPVVAALASIGYSLSLPNIYTATAKILPPVQSQSTASAILAQIGGIAGAAGSAAGFGKNPSDLYVAMLKSRTVLDNLIQRFKLDEYYGGKLASNTRKLVERQTVLTASKEGIITIEFDDRDPKRAAEIANAYIEELAKLTNVLAVTEASRRRLFFERQFTQAREYLVQAEAAARVALDKGGIANIEVQGRALLETTAKLRGEIAGKEIQIASMRAFAADKNPNLLKAQQELAAMTRGLAKIEGNASASDTGDSNVAGLANLRLIRDLKYREAVYELLARQFEAAKIDEAKEGAIIQVVDRAIEPDRKSKPKRAQMVMMATLVGGIFGVVLAFVLEAIERAKRNPATARRLGDLRSHLAWRRR